MELLSSYKSSLPWEDKQVCWKSNKVLHVILVRLCLGEEKLSHLQVLSVTVIYGTWVQPHRVNFVVDRILARSRTLSVAS